MSVEAAYEKLVGLSDEKLVGRNYADFLASRWGRDFFDHVLKDHLEQALESGKSSSHECWMDYGVQGRRFVQRNYSPCRNQREIVGVVVSIHDLTDIMNARDQLAESEARFRILLANIPNVAVQGYRMDGTAFYWNQASELIYGYSAEKALGRNLQDLIIPPEMREEVTAAMRHMAETGEPIPASELWLMRKDGSSVPVYSSHAIVKKENAPPELFCIDIDLTERLLAEKAVRKSSERLRSLYENTPAMLHSINDNGEIVSVSNMWLEKLGYARDEVLGRRSVDFFTEESRRRAVEVNIPRFFETGSAYDLPYQMVTKDGRILDVLMSGMSEYDEDGVFVRSMAVTEDVTERRKAEKALVESERRFRTLVENLPIMINAGTIDGIFSYWNKTCEEITGYSREEIVGNPEALALLYPDTADRERLIRKVKESGGLNKDQEWILTAKDGSLHTIVCTNLYSDLSFTDDELWAVSVDITARKLAEKAVLEQKAYLRSILDRTRDGFCIVDLQGNLIDVNEAFCHMYGHTREELLRLHIKDLDDDETPSEIAERMERIVTNGCELFEVRSRKGDGTLFNIEISSTFLNENGGQIVSFLRDITERKQAEAALQLREQLLEVTAAAALDFLRGEELGPCIAEMLANLGCATDSDRVYIFENRLDRQSKALLTNQTHEWVRSGITPQIDNPDLQNVDIEGLCPRWVAELGSGNPIMGHVRDFPEGERAILEAQKIQSLLVAPIHSNGNFWGFIGFDSVRSPRFWSNAEANVLRIIATAIGAAFTRKAMEKALEIKDHAIASTMDAVALADLDGRITYVNPAFLKIWGLKREEDAQGRNVTEFWFDVYHAAEVVRRVIEHVGAMERMIAKKADGTPVTVQVSANIVRDKKGNPICMMATFRDMTEQVQHERELAMAKEAAVAAHQRLLTVMNNIDSMISVTDLETSTILFMNESGKKWWGDVEGRRCWEVIHSGQSGLCSFCKIHMLLDEQNNPTGPFQWEYQDTRNRKWYELHDSVIRWIDGQPVHMQYARDITERKLAEEEIRSINQQLMTANAEKDKLFSIIAHDLKSPMSGLLSSISILANELETFSAAELQSILKELYKSSKNTFALLENLLQWASINQDIMVFSPGPCSLHELVNMSLYTAQGLAKQKNITIIANISSKLTVLVDQHMTNTVIRNVLFNAVKFTRTGGEIFITAQPEGEYIRLSVQDNGIGVDPKILPDLFAISKKKRQLGTAGEKGTGLGLILCKQFVEKHGGRIWVESEPGKGTTVFFTLPAGSA